MFVKFAPDEHTFSSFGVASAAPSNSDIPAPTLFMAIQEQLGLKLEEGKGPVDVLVVDHAERPAEYDASFNTPSRQTLRETASPALQPKAASSAGILSLTTSSKTRQAQSPASTPVAFEVASIKPSGRDDYFHGDCHGIDSVPSRRFDPGLGRCAFDSGSLKALISTAYSPVSFGGRLGFPMKQIEQADGLGWIGSEPFDIEAKAENPSTATEAQLYQMLQQLLAERFSN